MSEKYYDDVIAVKLKEVGKLCEAQGLPFVAICEYEPGENGRTEFMPDNASLSMHITAFAARCQSNIDALFIAIGRHCVRKKIDTSASFVMRRMEAK